MRKRSLTKSLQVPLGGSAGWQPSCVWSSSWLPVLYTSNKPDPRPGEPWLPTSLCPPGSTRCPALAAASVAWVCLPPGPAGTHASSAWPRCQGGSGRDTGDSVPWTTGTNWSTYPHPAQFVVFGAALSCEPYPSTQSRSSCVTTLTSVTVVAGNWSLTPVTGTTVTTVTLISAPTVLQITLKGARRAGRQEWRWMSQTGGRWFEGRIRNVRLVPRPLERPRTKIVETLYPRTVETLSPRTVEMSPHCLPLRALRLPRVRLHDQG